MLKKDEEATVSKEIQDWKINNAKNEQQQKQQQQKSQQQQQIFDDTGKLLCYYLSFNPYNNKKPDRLEKAHPRRYLNISCPNLPKCKRQ